VVKKNKVSRVFRILCVPVLLAHSAVSMAIDAPLNVRVVSSTPSQIVWQWDWVSGATQFEVTIDGQYAGLTPNPFFTADDLSPGDHSISVKAVDEDGVYSSPSVGVRVNTTNRSEDVSNDQALNSVQALNSEFNGERFEYRVINGEDQFYVNIFSDDQEHLTSVVPSYNPFEFDGSRLAIRAQRNPLKTSNNNAYYGPLNEIVAQQEFLSGAITTYDKFTQKYGYFEARIKIPSHVGTFPAFWLHHQRRAYEDTRKTEIDIMENLGHAPWYIYNSFHHFDNVSEFYSGDVNSVKPLPDGQIFNGTDFSLDFHTYAVKWEPGYIAWYLDDELVSEVHNDNVNHEELYVILNLAMGGYWTNFPENAGGLGREQESFFPNIDDLNAFTNPALEIDYVRVYERR